MARVELDIFSGRPNPVWHLGVADSFDLLDQIKSSKTSLLSPSLAESKLGYRGFLVTFNAEEMLQLGGSRPAQFRIRSGLDIDADAVAEKWLLDATPESLIPNDSVYEEAETGIEQPINRNLLDREALPNAVVLAACTVYATSSTDFSFWNGSAHRPHNNCYNYASNNRNNTYAQPGRRSGQKFTSLTLDNIANAMVRDGYRTTCDGRSLVTSLWIWPSTDYHFYRKTADVNGGSRWCHKPGQTSATNRDNSGAIIQAPATANRGNYNTGARARWFLGSSANVS